MSVRGRVRKNMDACPYEGGGDVAGQWTVYEEGKVTSGTK